MPYNAKHTRTQLKIYAAGNYDTLEVFAKKYLKEKDVTIHQYINTRLLKPNFADELCLILISQRYNVHIGVLTDGNGSSTHFKVLEQCKLIFLGMENKLSLRMNWSPF